MKLYEVTNGFIGESYVKVFVIAESDERAKELARMKFIDFNAERVFSSYSRAYWEDLESECICEDTNKEWATTPRDY